MNRSEACPPRRASSSELTPEMIRRATSLRPPALCSPTVNLPTFADVFAARRTLAGRVLHTPVLRSSILDALTGSELTFKAESLQLTGSYKVRGATNKILSLTAKELAAGLITVSAGNAALGAAWAAREAGAALTVVMPENAVPKKLAAVAAMGARIDKEGVTNATQAFARLAALREAHGLTLIHPFDDAMVIAGAGTATWELLEQAPPLDRLIVPTSGGGLLGGALLATQALSPATEVWGVQPEGADGLIRSLAAGTPTAPESIQTIADGLSAPKPGALNFAIIRRDAKGAVVVSDAEILAALGLLIEHLRVILEPSAAVGLAALLRYEHLRGGRIGVLLSGGNTGKDRVIQALG